VYGVMLLVRLKRSAGKTSKGSRQSQVIFKGGKEKNCFWFFCFDETFVVLLVTASFSLLFGIRAAFFLYNPITNSYLPGQAFFLFAYILPDSVPVMIEVFVIVSTAVSALRRKAATQSTNQIGYIEQDSTASAVDSTASAMEKDPRSMSFPLIERDEQEDDL
jgi:hypothetical protein